MSDFEAERCAPAVSPIDWWGGDCGAGLLPPRSGQVLEEDGVSEGEWEERLEEWELAGP
jgi:hypothetical protein